MRILLQIACAAVLGIASVAAGLVPNPATAQASDGVLSRWTGETVYVPAYTRFNTAPGGQQSLTSTLVMHNVDPAVTITLTRIEFLDETGTSLTSFLDEPRPLPPFGAASFVVPANAKGGGVGANFIVEWRSEAPALSPMAEAVMVGGSGTLGVSFTTRGRAIARR